MKMSKITICILLAIIAVLFIFNRQASKNENALDEIFREEILPVDVEYEFDKGIEIKEIKEPPKPVVIKKIEKPIAAPAVKKLPVNKPVVKNDNPPLVLNKVKKRYNYYLPTI